MCQTWRQGAQPAGGVAMVLLHGSFPPLLSSIYCPFSHFGAARGCSVSAGTGPYGKRQGLLHTHRFTGHRKEWAPSPYSVKIWLWVPRTRGLMLIFFGRNEKDADCLKSRSQRRCAAACASVQGCDFSGALGECWLFTARTVSGWTNCSVRILIFRKPVERFHFGLEPLPASSWMSLHVAKCLSSCAVTAAKLLS